ncbi:MAG TPA: outer membrane beta-barrel protein [Thermoanaerobaculia bacterium]|jgi:hypothetical protein|nr:outer membrane beta-barrel protein [Thermoanaerobaculia bacterium]
MRIVFLCVLLIALPLHAAEIEAGGSHVIAMAAGDTGTLDVKTSRGFSAHVEVFWSDRVSTRGTATFLNPAAILFPDNPPPTDVDLGTLGLDIYSATARIHFGNRFSAFAGGGAALVVIGNLDDQFGDAVEIEFDPETTFVAEAGVRYRIHPRVVLEMGVTYMPLELEAPAPLPSSIAVDPLIVSAGAAWRF